MPGLLQQLLKDERGATAIEYTLIVSLISAGLIGTFTIVGTELSSGFHTIGDALNPGATSAATSGGGAADQ